MFDGMMCVDVIHSSRLFLPSNNSPHFQLDQLPGTSTLALRAVSSSFYVVYPKRQQYISSKISKICFRMIIKSRIVVPATVFLSLLVLTVFHATVVTSLANIKSKSTSKTTGRTSAGGGGGGFGTGKKQQQQQPSIHVPDESPTTQRLIHFLAAQDAKGVGKSNIDIGFHTKTGIRGLFANKNFKSGKIICQIPSDCALALSDPNLNGDDVPTLTHNGINFLSMYWDNEQARTLWSPYLDTLPFSVDSDQFEPTPDFFSNDEIQLLEFPRLVKQVQDRKVEIETLAKEHGIDVDKLRLATWLISSRSFPISMSTTNTEKGGEDDNAVAAAGEEDDEAAASPPKYDDRGQVISSTEQKTIRVMVPFIDIANHSSDQPNAKLTLIDPEKDEAWFALEATRPIAEGKEIVIAYGNGVESSVELLLNYGFVPSHNRIDQFMLKKGGDDTISNIDDWTTTLEEDKTMLSMMMDKEDSDDDDDDSSTLKKILQFRIQLKESYVA